VPQCLIAGDPNALRPTCHFHCVMTDDSRRRHGSVTSVAGDYNSDTDLEEALLSGAHHGQRLARRTRGCLARSHSVSDNTTLQDSASSKPEALPGRGEEGGPSGERARRPKSARRLRLTASFDDGCSGRERVTARISSTILGITSIAITSSSCSVNSDDGNGMQQLDGNSSRNHPQKQRLRSSSVSRTGVNRTGISNSTSSLRNQPKSNALKDKDGEMNPSRPASKSTAARSTASDNAKIILNVSSRKDVPKRPAPLTMRRASSLDMNVMKSSSNGKAITGRQMTAARSGHRDQRNCKVGVPRAATMSANSSPRSMRYDRLQLTGNHTARYQYPSSLYFIANYTQSQKIIKNQRQRTCKDYYVIRKYQNAFAEVNMCKLFIVNKF